MNRAKIIGLLAVLLFCWTITYAEKEFEVTNVDLSSTEWGPQMAKISVTKLASDYRFVVALSEVKFIDSVAAPSRDDKRVFIIGPTDMSKSAEENTIFMEVPFLVPLAYGEGRVKFELYNVVDTLDALLTSQRFYVKEVEFSVDTAEAFKALIDSGIQAPLFVDQSASFDSYFNRIISLLFYRGKTATEIANQCGVTPSFVHKNAQHLIKKGYLRFASKIYTPALTIIDNNRLEEILPEIDGTIDVVYDDLKKNLSQYDATLKELIDSKTINNDSFS